MQLDSMILACEFLRSSSAINSTNGLKWDLYNNSSTVNYPTAKAIGLFLAS
ncbi:hypothetical protein A608_0943 [Helicobacter pylori CCHI 33]|nr:hypothetical protein HPHPH36_1005 [Helicobacter pylori Hp H-36]EMR57398.1 hypothetical protein A608_0943 [Helicobacter pylori CCHI 33]